MSFHITVGLSVLVIAGTQKSAGKAETRFWLTTATKHSKLTLQTWLSEDRRDRVQVATCLTGR